MAERCLRTVLISSIAAPDLSSCRVSACFSANALADELTEIRNAGPEQQPSHRVNPLKGDPFADFVGFATHQLTPRTRLRLRAGASVSDLQRTAGVRLDAAFAEWRGSLEEAARLLEPLAKGNVLTAQELLADFPTERHPVLMMSLAWL